LRSAQLIHKSLVKASVGVREVIMIVMMLIEVLTNEILYSGQGVDFYFLAFD